MTTTYSVLRAIADHGETRGLPQPRAISPTPPMAEMLVSLRADTLPAMLAWAQTLVDVTIDVHSGNDYIVNAVGALDNGVVIRAYGVCDDYVNQLISTQLDGASRGVLTLDVLAELAADAVRHTEALAVAG